MATTKTLTPTNQAITLADFTEKPDNRTNVTNDDRLADAVNALNSKIAKKCVWQSGLTSWTGNGSGWSYAQVTFPIPYSESPLVVVMPSTAQANPSEAPALNLVTKTGFSFGYYGKTGTINFKWQAIGNVD